MLETTNSILFWASCLILATGPLWPVYKWIWKRIQKKKFERLTSLDEVGNILTSIVMFDNERSSSVIETDDLCATLRRAIMLAKMYRYRRGVKRPAKIKRHVKRRIGPFRR